MTNLTNFPDRPKLLKLLEGPKVLTRSHLAKDKAKLIREARSLAMQRGHNLGEFTICRIVTGYPPVTSRGALSAACKKCKAQVSIDPEYGAIFGEAIENDCQWR